MSRWFVQHGGQGVDLVRTEVTGCAARYEAVESDEAQPVEVTYGSARFAIALQESTAIAAVRIQVTAAEDGPERGTVVVVSRAIDMRYSALRSERANTIRDCLTAANGTVIGDVATDDNHIEIWYMLN